MKSRNLKGAISSFCLKSFAGWLVDTSGSPPPDQPTVAFSQVCNFHIKASFVSIVFCFWQI